MKGTQNRDSIVGRRLEDTVKKVLAADDFTAGVYSMVSGERQLVAYIGDETPADDRVIKLPPVAETAWQLVYVEAIEEAEHTDAKITVESRNDEIDTKYTADLTASKDRVLLINVAGRYWHELDKVST